MDCYAIKDWEKHFENSESRKIKSLTWVPVKNKHDGKGYRRVVAHPKSIQVLCAWYLIVQVASKMPVRGVLRDDDGPLTTSDLAFKTGLPEHIFEEAFKVLSADNIGWLLRLKPDGVPEAPETSGDVGIEQKGTEGKGTEVFSPPHFPKSSLDRGSGGKVAANGGLRVDDGGECREIPDEEQAVAMTMDAGIDDRFVRFVYRQWFMQAGKNANGVIVGWLPYVTGRWANEQVEWKNGTHRGNRNASANGQASCRPRSVFELKTIMETKDKLAQALKNKFASEGPLSTDWSDQSKRTEYAQLKAEIKELQKQIGAMK